MPYPLRHRIAVLLGVILGVFGPFMLPAQGQAATAAVAIGSTLDPAHLTVAPGTTVTWTNNDGERHRVRTTSGPEEFDSGDLETGESYSYTFAIAGTYNYHDDRDDENSAYFGSVTVSATVPTTTPPSTTQPPTTPPAPGPSGVSMINDSFSPQTLTVAAGTTVTWTNNDDDEHTATANDGSFVSPTMVLGNTFSNTFNTAGTFDYFCIFHSGMTGTVVVTGGTTPTTVPPSTTTTTAPPAPGSGDVDIVDLAFSPASLTVSTGATVSWVNSGALPHTVTATDSSFDSGFMFTGDTYTRTFASAGTFNYLCTLHPEMTGTITVTGTNSAPAPSGGGVDTTVPPNGTTSGASSVQGSGTAAPAGSISMLDNRYSPASRSVSAGTSVSWVNQGAAPHTVTGSNFDSGFLMPGDVYRRTFNNPGTYSYLCTIHPGMTGTITVTGAATGAADSGAVESSGVDDDVVDPQALGDAEPEGAGTDTSGDAPQENLAISVVDLEFDPVDPKIFAGTKVTWTNVGELPHTVTATDGEFDSGIFLTGESFERVFEDPGTYAYLCTLHPGMEGTITVLEARVPAADTGAESDEPEVLAAGVSGVSGPLSPGGAIGLMAAAVAVIGVALAIGMARFGNALSREEPGLS